MPIDNTTPPDSQTARWAHCIADQAIVWDVECEGVLLTKAGAADHPTYDVSAMLDEREHSPPVTDMARVALAYGAARGLLYRVPAAGALVHVRLLRKP